MSAQIISALLNRAGQLDAAASALTMDLVRRPGEDAVMLRWLAGEFRAVARIAQGLQADQPSPAELLDGRPGPSPR